ANDDRNGSEHSVTTPGCYTNARRTKQAAYCGTDRTTRKNSFGWLPTGVSLNDLEPGSTKKFVTWFHVFKSVADWISCAQLGSPLTMSRSFPLTVRIAI